MKAQPEDEHIHHDSFQYLILARQEFAFELCNWIVTIMADEEGAHSCCRDFSGELCATRALASCICQGAMALAPKRLRAPATVQSSYTFRPEKLWRMNNEFLYVLLCIIYA